MAGSGPWNFLGEGFHREDLAGSKGRVVRHIITVALSIT